MDRATSRVVNTLDEEYDVTARAVSEGIVMVPLPALSIEVQVYLRRCDYTEVSRNDAASNVPILLNELRDSGVVYVHSSVRN